MADTERAAGSRPLAASSQQQDLTQAQKDALANAPVVKVPEPGGPLGAVEEVSDEQRAAQQAAAIANAPAAPPAPAPPGEPMSATAQAQALANAPRPEGSRKVEMPQGSPGTGTVIGDPSADIASVTVETEYPSGQSDETTIPPTEPPAVPKRR